MRKKRLLALGIFVAILLINIFRPMGNGFDLNDKEWQEEVFQAGGLDQIALLEIDGVILDGDAGLGFFDEPSYNHQVFLKQLEHAFSSVEFKGIVLQVNSPGGGIMESDEIFERIMKLKDEYKKPFVVYMGQLAASGGYYVSAPADKIYANRHTITGSIGVILGGNFNYKELMDKLGVKDQSFVSGPNKAILSPYQEMTEEQEEIIQEMVDESYQFFVDAIVAGRGLERSKVLELADGRIYSASQAKKLGLIDELGYLEDALAEAAKLAEVEEPTVIYFKAKEWPLFKGILAQMPTFSSDIRLFKELLRSSQYPRMMYMWQG